MSDIKHLSVIAIILGLILSFTIVLYKYSADKSCTGLAKELNQSQGTRVGDNCIITYKTGHKVVIRL